MQNAQAAAPIAIVQRLWRNTVLATSWLIVSQDMQQALLYLCCTQLVQYTRKAQQSTLLM